MKNNNNNNNKETNNSIHCCSCEDGQCHEHEHNHEHEYKHNHKHGPKHIGSCSCCGNEHEHEFIPAKEIIKISAAIATFIAALLIPADGILKLGIFLIPYLIIGHEVLIDAVKNILKGKVFDEQFLMSIATIGAFAIGEYTEGVAVMVFYSVGEFFQNLAVGKSKKSIAALMNIRPDYAIVLRDGKEVTVSPEDVQTGETIVIRPGEKIPLDGIIIKGETSVDTSALTGESLPQNKVEGNQVLSGSINIDGLIYMRCEGAYHESTVSKILDLVESSTEKKSKADNFITRFSRFYTPCVVIGALLLAFIPPIFVGNLSSWINRGLVFLVVSCPCALVISVPLSFFGGIGGASKKGILIKGSNYLEALSTIDTVVFDKTGTLTKGTFTVASISSDKMNEHELLRIAAMAESFSSHPIAECIVNSYKEDIDKSAVTDVKEIAGKGIRATMNDKTYYLGNAALMELAGAKYDTENIPGTIIHISEDADYLGYLVILDEIKSNSADAVKALKNIGIRKTIMLTGDNKIIAKNVADTLNLDEIHAELLPGEKVDKVEKLLAEKNKVAFVGDGINDAPVLARADVGIAMGGIGSDAAIESADVVLMDDNPVKIATAIKISRKTMGIVKQNIFFSLSVKGIILTLGALGYAGMWLAVFGDVGVMLLATLNSMRAMTIKE